MIQNRKVDSSLRRSILYIFLYVVILVGHVTTRLKDTTETPVFSVNLPNALKQHWRMSTSHVILGVDNDLSSAIDTQGALQEVSKKWVFVLISGMIQRS